MVRHSMTMLILGRHIWSPLPLFPFFLVLDSASGIKRPTGTGSTRRQAGSERARTQLGTL